VNSRIHWVSVYVRLASFAGTSALLTAPMFGQSSLSTTHYVSPRTVTATIGFHF
jgi:hypothetical protein